VEWGGVHCVAIRPKPKKGGKMSSDAEDIPEKVDTGVRESYNAQVLPAALTLWWTCVGE